MPTPQPPTQPPEDSISVQPQPKPRGNTEHLHLHCAHSGLTRIRHDANTMVDNACRAYLICMGESMRGDDAGIQHIILSMKLRELEIETAQTMNAQCMKALTTTRETNITYKTTPEKTCEIHLRTPVNRGEPSSRFGAYPFARSMGLTSDLQEGELPSLTGASALDFTHIGLYPDMIYEWHQENCSMAKKDERVKLKKAWLRIEATMITRPEIMQRAIKHELDKFEKDILKKRYPILEPLANKAEKRTTSMKTRMPRRRAYSVDSEAETTKASEELTATDDDSSITEPETTRPEEQRQTKNFICAGITCKPRISSVQASHAKLPDEKARE
jgi:hypothetical protein